MRRSLINRLRFQQDVFEMLNIRLSTPLINSRAARGTTNTTLSDYNSGRATSRAYCRSQTTFASNSQQHQGRHEGSNPHSHHEQHKIDNQKHAYNTITESWNVPRTSLSHFPAETQRHIRENKRGERPSTAAAAVTRATTPPEAAQLASSSPLQASITKALQVLAYESKAGYTNFQGKSGEHFTEWMANTLRVLSSDLTSAGRGSLAQQCEELSIRYVAGYEAMLNGAREERQSAVAEMTGALTKLSHELQTQPKQMDRSRIGITNTIGTVDIDAEAAEAHAEETATTTATTAPTTGAFSASVNADTPSDSSEATGKYTTNLGDEYVMVNGRRIKASTVAFRQSFAEAAAIQHAATSSSQISKFSNGEQRTSQWLSLRERRLTASAFSKALGFFPGDRESLWEEKVGLKAPFAGNDATSWGTRMEPEALQQYEALTGQRVESCMFRVKHDDPPHGWLGASPDGLVQGLEIFDTQRTTISNNTTATAAGGLILKGDSVSSSSSSLLGQGPGILEIKCPYNRGHPELAIPPERAIWYYMPQLQGLMDIFDRQWCSLYIWTQFHGSASFQVGRKEEYWAAAFEILAEFWWAHVVPARQAHDAGAPKEEIEAFRPIDQIDASEKLRRWSKQLAAEAPATFYSIGRKSGGTPAQRY